MSGSYKIMHILTSCFIISILENSKIWFTLWDQPNFLQRLRHCRSYVCFVKRPQKISYFIIICAKIKATFYICFNPIWIFLNCNKLSISDSSWIASCQNTADKDSRYKNLALSSNHKTYNIGRLKVYYCCK